MYVNRVNSVLIRYRIGGRKNVELALLRIQKRAQPQAFVVTAVAAAAAAAIAVQSSIINRDL